MKTKDFENFITIPSKSRNYYDNDCEFKKQDWYPAREPILAFLSSVVEKNEQSKKSQLEDIHLSIGESKFVLPNELKEIGREITDSFYLLKLEDDWDGMDAKKIDHDVFLKSIDFLIEYSTLLYKFHNILISAPEINPGIDGSVDLSWRTLNVRLLINVKKKDDQIKMFYYRDHYNNEKSAKGEITLENLDESFFTWMKFLKK